MDGCNMALAFLIVIAVSVRNCAQAALRLLSLLVIAMHDTEATLGIDGPRRGVLLMLRLAVVVIGLILID
jgi:hypothetical protein